MGAEHLLWTVTATRHRTDLLTQRILAVLWRFMHTHSAVATAVDSAILPPCDAELPLWQGPQGIRGISYEDVRL